MAAFRPSAHALNRVVAGLGPERVVIPSLGMAAGDVSAYRSLHATRNPVQVGKPFVSKLSFSLLLLPYLLAVQA